jgi:hypothetical protein
LYDLSQVGSEKITVENLASRLMLEKCHKKSNGLTYQENLKNGFRFLVKVVASVAQRKWTRPKTMRPRVRIPVKNFEL